ALRSPRAARGPRLGRDPRAGRRARAAGRRRARDRLPPGVRGRGPGRLRAGAHGLRVDGGARQRVGRAHLLGLPRAPLVRPRAAARGGPAQLPRPTIEGGTGLSRQNLFYARQWWVFGGFAVLLWVRLVRDEAAGVRRHGRRESSGIAGLPGD